MIIPKTDEIVYTYDNSTIHSVSKLYNTHHVQPSEQRQSEWTANDSFWGSYLVSKLNSSCYTEHELPRQIYA